MKAQPNKRELTAKQSATLLAALKHRFDLYPDRHRGVDWVRVEARLRAVPDKLWSLGEMERTGGEPDLVAWDPRSGDCLFQDCSPETPKGRASLCYDHEGWESRKEHRPAGNAVDVAADMGVELLTEEAYMELQRLGEFDRKTSSWVWTPSSVRDLGGALYCERRYGRIFTGHNGAQSYYRVRGFRAALHV